MKKNLTIFITILFILLVFINYNIVLESTITSVYIWLHKVFPYLFIMIILNDILISSNVINYFSNIGLYVFIMSILSGTPSSAYITSKLFKEQKITKNEANTIFLFTYFCNPLFLYTILLSIFNNQTNVIKLMFTIYLSNTIIFLFNKNKLSLNNLKIVKTNISISNAIKNSITTTTMVLGTITFYFILTNIIIKTFNFNIYTSIILKGLLEVTNGLNSLINTSIYFKEYLTILIISFGGLSIHTQVKCILDESKLNYKYFLKGRIQQCILSFIILLLINLLFYLHGLL